MISPKIEIINYFDELINQVDIDIEKSLKTYNENQILANLKRFEFEQRRNFEIENIKIIVKIQRKNENQAFNLWSESTKVVDYLNQVRMRTIELLRKSQEETLEYYKLNSSRFNSLEEMFTEENKIEEFKRQIFAEKFYFQVSLTNECYEQCVFKLFTFVTDFYMSSSDIKIFQ